MTKLLNCQSFYKVYFENNRFLLLSLTNAMTVVTFLLIADIITWHC